MSVRGVVGVVGEAKKSSVGEAVPLRAVHVLQVERHSLCHAFSVSRRADGGDGLEEEGKQTGEAVPSHYSADPEKTFIR